MREDYELQFSGKVNDVTPISKYLSKKTGLRVIVAEVEGPIVNGYFCLATEAHDDDGLPHTLEHLVFMGSEEYPYKGVLDLLANRCLASGTNAWTDTDHTCYTMTTAGSEGFLNLLPVFLDHVLYPNLTESAYLTEVHHINEEGEDAGVVYCEMQARENTGDSRCHLEMLRAMYPGHCGYKSETGGIMANLRDSTSHEKVCRYHKDFYRAENLYLIITGTIKAEDVFEAIKNFEDKISRKDPLPAYVRPWQGAVPPLEASVTKTVKFPSDDEECGMVLIGWRGPPAEDQYLLSALSILLVFLTDTAIAPLQKHFVEIDDPYCNDVHHSIIENSHTCFYLKFTSVSMDKLQQIRDKLLSVMGDLASGSEPIDMVRMDQVIHRQILSAMSSLEDTPHDTIAFHVIGEFLYGNTPQDMEMRVNQIESFKKLASEKLDFWTGLLKKYVVDKPVVSMVGEPSMELMEEMGRMEKERVAHQVETLQAAELKRRGERLIKATQDNEVEPPREMLTSVSVPSVDSIHFHTIHPSSNHDKNAKMNESFPLGDIPITFELDDIKTNFVMFSVLMDTSCVPAELRPFLPLYSEIILESPVLRDTGLVSHEDIVQQLAADTVEADCEMGLGGKRFSCGSYSTQLVLSLKVEMEKYERAIDWVRELLYQVQFTEERVKIIAQKMTTDVSSLKRRGQTVVRTLSTDLNYNKESNHYTSSMLRQFKFLKTQLENLDQDQSSKVVDSLNKLREVLTSPANLRVHMAAHVERLVQLYPQPHQLWLTNLLPLPRSTLPPPGHKLCVKKDWEFMLGSEGRTGVIAGVGSVESSFLIQTTPALTSHLHPDLPAIMTYIQYLCQLEGPMWKQIRGLGLSYHYNMYVKPDAGLLYFILFKSTHIVSAYKQAKQIVDGYLSGSTPLDTIELDTCKSSLMYEIVEDETTPSAASCESLKSYLHGVPQGHGRYLIEKVSQVTLDDLQRVGQKYFAPLFDPQQSKCAVVCHPTKVDGVTKDFAELGRSLEDVGDLDECFLADM